MGLEVRAVAKYVGISPQKVRRVINLVRGKRPEDALALLQFIPQAAAKPVAKTIASAMANAEENFGLAREDLVIARITADQAPMRRWRRFGARGRFKPIVRRASHITVVLTEKESA
ncbi:MAG: 50S ribosomal protein L22 [Anaerolineae bacterium]|nr:50S ribosomal protein L22 [Anaerolineae bacterium]MDW8100111.1 50S ribosomal protein L22 [Anaerolineae bacterium]